MMASDAGSHASLTFRHQLPKSSHRCYRKPWSPPVRCRWKGWHTAMCRSRPIHYVLEECRDQTQTLQNVVRELYCESLFERLEVIILSRTFFCDALSLCGPHGQISLIDIFGRGTDRSEEVRHLNGHLSQGSPSSWMMPFREFCFRSVFEASRHMLKMAERVGLCFSRCLRNTRLLDPGNVHNALGCLCAEVLDKRKFCFILRLNSLGAFWLPFNSPFR